MDKYFSMGGHGAYIWPAYLIAAVILITLLVTSFRAVRTREAQLKALRQVRRSGSGESE